MLRLYDQARQGSLEYDEAPIYIGPQEKGLLGLDVESWEYSALVPMRFNVEKLRAWVLDEITTLEFPIERGATMRFVSLSLSLSEALLSLSLFCLSLSSSLASPTFFVFSPFSPPALLLMSRFW